MTKIKTIDTISMGEYKSMNSKFLSFLHPLEYKEDLKSIIQDYRKKHPKAVHVCFAYRLGYEIEECRMNDDGEPSGTAGKPMLNILYSYEIKNCLLIIVRYYGGIKLGIPGLIEAYKEASIDAINKATIVEKEEKIIIQFDLNHLQLYAFYEKVKKINATILTQQYNENHTILDVLVEKNKMNLLDEYK